MTKTIINGKIFEYDEEHLTYETIHPISQEDGKVLLSKTKELFDHIGLDFYLAFGTLLGAVREKKIITGDEDIDIFINNENLLYTNLPFLAQNGLKVFRIQKGILYSFRLNEKSYIDVYILSSLPKYNLWSKYCLKLSQFITPKKYFKEYQKIDFLDNTFMCPKNPEKLLEFWYGENWRIPQKGHKFIYEVKSAHYWHKFSFKIKAIIKSCIGWQYWKNVITKHIH